MEPRVGFEPNNLSVRSRVCFHLHLRGKTHSINHYGSPTGTRTRFADVKGQSLNP